MDDTTKRVAARHLEASDRWHDVKDKAKTAEWNLKRSIEPAIKQIWEKAHKEIASTMERDIEDELKKAGFKVIKVEVDNVGHWMNYDLEEWSADISGEVDAIAVDDHGDPEVVDLEELEEALSEVGVYGPVKTRVGRKTVQFAGKNVKLLAY